MILYRLYRYEIQKQWGKLLFYNDGNIDGLSLLESSEELKITKLSTENYRWNYRQTKSLEEFYRVWKQLQITIHFFNQNFEYLSFNTFYLLKIGLFQDKMIAKEKFQFFTAELWFLKLKTLRNSI